MLIFRDNSFELQPSVAAIARQKKGGQPRGHDLNIWNSSGRWVCLAFDRLQKVIWANFSDLTADWSPQMVVSFVRDPPPKSPKHAGLGNIVICPVILPSQSLT